MPPTESRSRDEWLAEVRRRGERIRRRRRITAALVGALALVLPVTALTTFLGGAGPGSVELSVAGPAPTTQVSTAPDSPVAEPGVALSTEIAPAPSVVGGSGGAGASPSPTTTAEVHARVATVNGSTTPRQTPTSTPTVTPTSAPTTSVPPADDPVLRPPAGTTATTGRSGTTATADTTIPPAEPVAECPASDIKVTVTTDKSMYGHGDTVEGSATIENRSAAACRVPTWFWPQILDGAGRNVFHESPAWEFRGDPRAQELSGTSFKAEPGATYTGFFRWAARNCSVPAPAPGTECAGRFPAGTYTVVVRWGDNGLTASTTFQLSG